MKELEERSKSSAQSESDRNRVLVQEAAHLRRELLKIRSKVLRLSVSLNAVGSEVGKILDKEGPEESVKEGGNAQSRSVDAEIDAEQTADPPGSLAVQMSQGPMDEEHIDHGNEVPGSPIQAGTVLRVTDMEASEVPAENTHLPREDNANFAEHGNTTRHNSFGQTLHLKDCITALPHQYSNMDYVVHASGSVPGELVPDETTSNPPPLFANDENDELPLDLPLASNTSFSDLGSGPYSNLEEWMMNMFAPAQDLGFGTIEEGASESLRTAQQETISTSEVGEGLSISIPAALSRIGFSLPPGLFPAAKNMNSYVPCEMHSRLSEHMEALEQYARCMLYTESGQISRKR